VRVVLADVAQEADVARLLDEIETAQLPPLRGIVHAAGVDALAVVSAIDRDQLRTTLAPKVAGAFLLDRLTKQRGIELSLFVCTSSISSVWGGMGQAAYSAANAFLDSFAEQRRGQGRAATTINYGPWARVGMGTANQEGIAWLRSRGIRALEPEFALDGMEAALAGGAATTLVAEINWTLFRELVELQRPRPLFEQLGRPKGEEAQEAQPGQETAATALVAQLTNAAPDERAELFRQAVKSELAGVLQRPVAELGDDVGFFDLGMDSLMAVEFRNALAARLGRKLPATVVMDSPDIDSMVEYVLTQVLGLESGKSAQQGRRGAAGIERDTTKQEIDELSQSEVESALDEELKVILRA
jgi:acyl carrier protein